MMLFVGSQSFISLSFMFVSAVVSELCESNQNKKEKEEKEEKNNSEIAHLTPFLAYNSPIS